MTLAAEIPSNAYKFSLGKQTALGSPVANPDYQIPVYEADLGPMEERQTLELINGQAFLPGKYKSKAWFEGDVTWASEAASLPRILAAHFGTASDTVTGAGDPRTHTFIRKDTLQPHTAWVGRPVAGGTFEYDKGTDCFATSLSFIYEAERLFKVASHIWGRSSVTNATAPTPTNVVQVPAAGVFGHTWAGAVLNLDLAATPGVTPITNLRSFTIKCEYPNFAGDATQNLNPDFYSQGLWEASFEAEFILQNWAAYNHTFYGTASPGANTAQSSATPSGALSFTVQQEPVSSGRTVQIDFPYVQYELARPTPNVDGSGITATMTGTLSLPASGEPITVAAKNAVAASYS